LFAGAMLFDGARFMRADRASTAASACARSSIARQALAVAPPFPIVEIQDMKRMRGLMVVRLRTPGVVPASRRWRSRATFMKGV